MTAMTLKKKKTSQKRDVVFPFVNGVNWHQSNPDTDLDSLSAGQVLCEPQENIACRTASAYTVAQDDTLESIALRWNVSVGALLRANPCLAPSPR